MAAQLDGAGAEELRVAAGAVCLSAYFVSRRRAYLFTASLFLLYFLDMALIFQYEYLGQNLAYSFESFYGIDHPVLRTVLAFAFFAMRAAADTLRLRFKEPPSADNPDLRGYIDELLPAYCERYKLTAREREIVQLVLEGKDNQNIASTLQLALGTVKAHVHNILKKTGHANRTELAADFWER